MIGLECLVPFLAILWLCLSGDVWSAQSRAFSKSQGARFISASFDFVAACNPRFAYECQINFSPFLLNSFFFFFLSPSSPCSSTKQRHARPCS